MRPGLLLGWLAMAFVAAGSVQAQDGVKIGFITKFPVPFFTSMEDAAKAYAAEHPGVEIVFGQGASATDIEGQIALIESMVTSGVQGIALTPVDPTVATALDKAIEAGVKVVLMDNNIPDWEGRTALATTDNYAAGKIAGAHLKTLLKDGDTLGILEGVPGVPSLDDRVNGMLEGLEGVAVDIVGRGATNCTEELGISVAEDLLTANPDLKAIYAACGPPAAGAARAITNAGIAPENIVLVGFDFCCGEAEALAAGIEDATVAQFPTKMAELGVDALVKIHPRRAGRIADRLRSRPGDQRQHGRVPVGQGGAGRRVGPRHPIPPNSGAMDRNRGINVQFVETLVCSEPGRLHLERRPAPRPAEGQVLVRPLRVGICGTDYHIFEGKHPFLEYPRVMGHELAVEIVDAPDESVLAPGEVCVVNPYLVVRAVRRLPQRKAQLLRTHLGARGAPGRGHGRAPFAPGRQPDAGARPHPRPVRDGRVPRHRRPCGAPGRVSARDRVLVVGAGPIGLGVALFARQSGAQVIVFDRAADRSESARSIAGVDTVPADAGPLDAGLPDGAGFDVVFDATGSPPAMERGFDYVAHGGRFVLVSVVKEPITFMDPDFHRKEMSLFGSRNATAEDFQRVISAHRDGQIPIDRLITHRTGLASAVRDIPKWATEKTGLIKALMEIN